MALGMRVQAVSTSNTELRAQVSELANAKAALKDEMAALGQQVIGKAGAPALVGLATPPPPPPPPEQVASMGKSSGAPKSPQGASSLITGEDTLVDKVPPPPLAHPPAPHDA